MLQFLRHKLKKTKTKTKPKPKTTLAERSQLFQKKHKQRCLFKTMFLVTSLKFKFLKPCASSTNESRILNSLVKDSEKNLIVINC